MKKVLVLTLATAALVGCSSDKLGDDEMVVDMLPKTRSIELTPEQREFVTQNTDFSFNLFRTINEMDQEKKSNIISPISVTYVMGMLNDGATGQTAKEITSVIGFGEDNIKGVNEFCQTLITEAPKADPSVTLEIANTVIGNKFKNVQFASAYEKDLKSYYAAEVSSLDFSKTKDALKSINGWCKKKTHGMIPEILSEAELKPEALLVLMNAIYFKATWTDKFDKKDTRNETFTTENGQQQTLPMMHRKATVLYGENDTFSILYLPYGSGDKWCMKVLLPNEGKTVEDVIASLNAESWKDTRQVMWNPIVDIQLPRFTTNFETDLKESLSKMGAPRMFDRYMAEFPNISKNFKDIYVSLMKQKAAIEVSEEGTKASAVTVAIGEAMAAIGGDKERPMKVDFHADRPFVYIIQEASSGVIFFMGTYRGK